MPTRKVEELAGQLAEELHRHEPLDDESRAALEALRGEVDRTLRGEEPEAPPSAQARTLTERLERDHPELTALIQRLADALMAAGV
ncbi:MAG TPA: DUF4404 family protein [Sandaracinaceae bacterium LLY-WYZ-13_1]|nr:DUF4404 family protein [Sandaracinaceae bacterium LLY-WYZ-13_1]